MSQYSFVLFCCNAPPGPAKRIEPGVKLERVWEAKVGVEVEPRPMLKRADEELVRSERLFTRQRKAVEVAVTNAGAYNCVGVMKAVDVPVMKPGP